MGSLQQEHKFSERARVLWDTMHERKHGKIVVLYPWGLVTRLTACLKHGTVINWFIKLFYLTAWVKVKVQITYLISFHLSGFVCTTTWAVTHWYRETATFHGFWLPFLFGSNGYQSTNDSKSMFQHSLSTSTFMIFVLDEPIGTLTSRVNTYVPPI